MAEISVFYGGFSFIIEEQFSKSQIDTVIICG
jgi:hypothetical protein